MADRRPPLLSVTGDPPPLDGSILTLAAWVRRQPEGNRNRGFHWASCRASERIAAGTLTPQDALILVDAAIRSGLGHEEVKRTYMSAMRSVPVLEIEVDFTSWDAGLTPQELAALAPRPYTGPAYVKTPRSLADVGFKPTDFAVLSQVWLRCDYRSGQCRASGPELAAWVGCCERTARYSIGRLARDGWLEIVEARDGRNGGYVLQLGWAARALQAQEPAWRS